MNVKDKTLAKYFLDNFIRRINELTPNLNFKKNNFLKFKKLLIHFSKLKMYINKEINLKKKN